MRRGGEGERGRGGEGERGKKKKKREVYCLIGEDWAGDE